MFLVSPEQHHTVTKLVQLFTRLEVSNAHMYSAKNTSIWVSNEESLFAMTQIYKTQHETLPYPSEAAP